MYIIKKNINTIIRGYRSNIICAYLFDNLCFIFIFFDDQFNYTVN